MAMHDTSARLHKELEEVFPDGLTYRQLWFMSKIGKATRLYCRSNTAFNNFMNSVFSGVAKFEQVMKTKPGGETYQGLKITMKMADGTEVTENGQAGDEE